MKLLHEITVHGKHKTWVFQFYADPKYVPGWRADGLEVGEVLNTIPAWWVDTLGLPPGWWCFWQDVLRFRSPWRKFGSSGAAGDAGGGNEE